MKVVHEIPPLYDVNSRALILGSLPSPRSREAGFFYMHPQNRFWRVLAAVFGEDEPVTKEERAAFAHKKHIALWDVIAECDITGASDSSVKNAKSNDFSMIFQKADIRAVFTTGALAAKLYRKFTRKESIPLPSPSPANCATPLTALVEKYSVIKEYLYE